MIQDTGYEHFNIWEHSAQVKALYRRRCRQEEPEMDCAAQAMELLAPLVCPGDQLLDAGCGSGYLFHSVKRRGLALDYEGIDASRCLVEIGREELPSRGCKPSQLRVMRLEDLSGAVDHAVCLNVLSNIDNYHRPLERLLFVARKSVILRESCWEKPSQYLYVRDRFLDPAVNLKVHVNTYCLSELMNFAQAYGFSCEAITDRRTQGRPELVIGYDHHWTFLVFRRNQ
jgi:ubiquinone/menaquinone biosynthesis C-methylase UbiE